ncbi:MAG: tetratricopeptide repeat protein [Calditrichaeota bacterium]|nr:tetratricopeptide repeat protein [Calditrichota bacterium]
MLKPHKKITRRQIKEDPLVTYYFKTLDFMREHSQKFYIGAIVFLALIFLFVMFSKSKRNAELNASEALTKANYELSQNKTQEPIDILLNMVDNYSGTKSAAKGVFLLGKAYYEKGDYEKAQLYFQRYLDDYGDDPILTGGAYSGLGASLEQQNKFLEAAQIYERGAKKIANDFLAPRLWMKAGRCYQRANEIAKARACYQTVIEKYAESNFKTDAELYLAKLNA